MILSRRIQKIDKFDHYALVGRKFSLSVQQLDSFIHLSFFLFTFAVGRLREVVNIIISLPAARHDKAGQGKLI